MLWLSLLPLFSFLVFSCHGSETPTQIFSRLMKNYSRHETPGFPDKPTEVQLGIYVKNLQYLGDETEDFMISFYLRQKWKDPRLSFSTTDGSMKRIRLLEDSWKQIWIPDTYISSARNVKADDGMSSNRFVRLTSDGDVWYVMQVSAVIPTRFKVTKYPFDEQRLELTFESFGYTVDELYFTTLIGFGQFGSDLGLRQFSINNFQLHDCTQNYTAGTFSCLQMVLFLERTSYQFVIQFYLPSTLIVILSWLAFWIDLETSSPSRLLTGIFSFMTLIMLDAFADHSKVATHYRTPFNCWMIACYVFVFGTLVEFAVVNILWRKTSGARGLEYLKPPFAGAEMGIEANKKQVDGSGGDGKRKARLVDWFSRIFFPFAFLLFNLIYWIKARA